MEVIRINYDKNEIIKRSKASEICFKCSACSKFCVVTKYIEKYDQEHSFIVHLFSADRSEALKDVWMCCVCEKCAFVCPQDSDPCHVFNNLKELSYKEGFAPEQIYKLTNQLLDSTGVYPINNAVNHARTKIGLKEIVINEKVKDEINIIAKKTGLIK